ncbi:MAG: hypothetical protein ACHRXM_04155 [Isosphaerales bacterium]
MGRVVPLILAVISVFPACGCGGLGWYRAAGHLPGIAATDYAFYDFCGTSSQLFPFAPLQVESALIEALGDLGFKVLEPPIHHPDGEALIHAHAPDGRPADVTVTPQNRMTNVRVTIGPGHIGDEDLSHELLRRVAENFGTVLRAYNPIETTLPRRINLARGVPPQPEPAAPTALKGEGLRPNESRDKAAGEEAAAPGSETVPPTNLPSPFQGFVPTRDNPNPPNMPYAPFPYAPYNDFPQN